MPILKKACFCVRLRNGTLIIGWLGCICISLSILITIFMMLTSHIKFSILNLLIIPDSFLQYLLCVCLIKSVYTQNPKLLLPWLVVAVTQSVSLNIIGLHLVVSIPEGWQVIIIVFLIANAISIYLWLIVYSYYQELKGQQTINWRDLTTDV